MSKEERPTCDARHTPATLDDCGMRTERRMSAHVRNLWPSAAHDTLSRTRAQQIRDFSTPTHPGWAVGGAVVAAAALTAGALGRAPLGSGIAVALLTIAALVDVRERRLPDVIVAASAVAFGGVIALEMLGGRADISALHIAAGTAALAGPLFALHLIAPSSMGFGDVKAAAVLGAAVGAIDWQLAFAALALAAGATATVGIARRVPTIAFGPGLVTAAAIVLCAHPLLLDESTRFDDPPSVVFGRHLPEAESP